jgi:membrane-associated PAP2 superfamily phosphatase
MRTTGSGAAPCTTTSAGCPGGSSWRCWRPSRGLSARCGSWPWSAASQLALTTLASLLVVSTLKLHSLTSCPWELHEFGGTVAYVSHWAWGVRDGGSGACFPGGHASAGFAFLGGFFAFRHTLPRAAQRWLAGALLAGLVLGLAQQVRGAHYMSHTLWTAWLCWASAALADNIVSQMLSQRPSPDSSTGSCARRARAIASSRSLGQGSRKLHAISNVGLFNPA